MMQPVYINHIASIHADTASGESPYLSANEPDYKSIITNAALRRRMSRIIKMGVACGLGSFSSFFHHHIIMRNMPHFFKYLSEDIKIFVNSIKWSFYI